jgi:hypothetical protein
MARRNAPIASMFGLTILVAVSLAAAQLNEIAQAQVTKPIQQPINGNEDISDLSRPEQALAQF